MMISFFRKFFKNSITTQNKLENELLSCKFKGVIRYEYTSEWKKSLKIAGIGTQKEIDLLERETRLHYCLVYDDEENKNILFRTLTSTPQFINKNGMIKIDDNFLLNGNEGSQYVFNQVIMVPKELLFNSGRVNFSDIMTENYLNLIKKNPKVSLIDDTGMPYMLKELTYCDISKIEDTFILKDANKIALFSKFAQQNHVLEFAETKDVLILDKLFSMDVLKKCYDYKTCFRNLDIDTKDIDN